MLHSNRRLEVLLSLLFFPFFFTQFNSQALGRHCRVCSGDHLSSLHVIRVAFVLGHNLFFLKLDTG